jgi:hypothetical protein
VCGSTSEKSCRYKKKVAGIADGKSVQPVSAAYGFRKIGICLPFAGSGDRSARKRLIPSPADIDPEALTKGRYELLPQTCPAAGIPYAERPTG